MSDESFRILKHDIRSNIGSIFSAIKLLKEKGALNGENRAVVDLILAKEKSVERILTELINLGEAKT